MIRIQLFRYLRGRGFATKVGHRWGFEDSKYAGPDDGNVLEKNLRGGCRIFVSRSGDTLVRSYELLADLAGAGDVILDDCFIGHRFSNDRIAWPIELTAIKQACPKTKLAFVAAPVDSLSIIDSSNSHEDILEPVLDVAMGASVLRMGLDLPTEYFFNVDEKGLDKLLSSITQYRYKNSRENSSSSSSSNVAFDVLCVATNALTVPRGAARVIHLARSLGITVIATETTRLHPRRPGAFATQISSNSSSDGASARVAAKSEAERYRAMTGALDNFKRSLEHALQAETNFIEKHKLSWDTEKMRGMTIDSFCWGHRLAAGHQGIFFPEEWTYIRHQQVAPALKDALDFLKSSDSGSKTYQDWAKLYNPLVNALLRHFAVVLEKRKTLMTAEVAAALTKSLISTGSSSTSSDGPVGSSASASLIEPDDVARVCGHLAFAIGADMALLADTEVLPLQWENDTDRKEYGTSFEAICLQDTLAMYKIIDDIVVSYCD